MTITAYGGPPDPGLVWPDPLDPAGPTKIQLPAGTVEMSRWFSDTIQLVLARGLMFVVGEQVGAGSERMIHRIEVYPQTADPAVLADLQAAAASIEVQLLLGDEVEYRCPLAGVLVLDSVTTQRLAALEKRIAAYEAELGQRLSGAGELLPIEVAAAQNADPMDGFTRLSIPIHLEPGQRIEVKLVSLPSSNYPNTPPCALTIALQGHTKMPAKPSIQLSPYSR